MKSRGLILFLILSCSLLCSMFLVESAHATDQSFEVYNTGDDDFDWAYGSVWQAQTFTVGVTAHSITKVRLLLYIKGDPLTCTCSIRGVDSSTGHPNSTVFTTVDFVATSFSTTPLWYFINFTETNLLANAKYAIVMKGGGATSSNSICWQLDTTSASYSGGNYERSANSGSTWTANTNFDYMFEVWGGSISRIEYNSSKIGVFGGNESGTIWTFYGFWYGIGINLSGFIFSYNVSGSMANDTWIAFLDTNNSWSNVSKSITLAVGNYVSSQIYANGSDNSWNVTSVLNILVTATIMFYFDSGGTIERNDTALANATSTTYNTLIPHLKLEALASANFSFLNWTVSYLSNTSNPFVFTVVNQTYVWCHFGNVSAGVPFIYARFTFNSSAPYQGETIAFDGSGSNSSVTITSYLWDFGDNGTGSGLAVTHIYSVDGSFTVNLTVIGGSMKDTMLQNITVLATTINISFDWNDLLFGSGAWIPLIIFIAIAFLLVTFNKWAIVAGFPMLVILALLYFTNSTDTYPLIWHGLIMICSAIVLLIYSAARGDNK